MVALPTPSAWLAAFAYRREVMGRELEVEVIRVPPTRRRPARLGGGPTSAALSA